MIGIRRNVKKVVYVIAFAFIVLIGASLIVYGGFDQLRQFWLRADTPPLPQREPIVVERLDTVIHEGTVDIAARVRNPNPGVGISDYTMTFVLLSNDGVELDRIQRRTYILPGSLNYVAVIGAPLLKELGKVQITLPTDPTFVSLPEHVSLPNFNTFVRERHFRTIGQRQLEELKGVIINTSTLDFNRVEITGVALDSGGQVVGIGTTFVGELRVREQREFSLQWPVPSQHGERIIILPSTNIYQEGNILPITGDPNLLR